MTSGDTPVSGETVEITCAIRAPGDGLPVLHWFGPLCALVGRANTRQVPMTMQLASPVEHTHGFARTRWRANGPDGSAIMRGAYLGRLSLDGNFELVVSSLGGPPSL